MQIAGCLPLLVYRMCGTLPAMRSPLTTLVLGALCATVATAASWTYDEFKNSTGQTYEIQGPTVITQGPDLRYYIGAKGRIDILTVDSNYVVTDHCTSVGISPFRTVLGITFDPKYFRADDIIFFASTSFLEFAGGRSAIPDPTSWMWQNGRVDVFRTNVGGNCLASVGALVTGLPVSNHDHGVNGLAFDYNGNLLVSNGGMTNAGYSEQGDGDGGYPATPLSGALLEVDFNKNNYEGRVLYTVPDGRRTQIRNSPDVKIYASGFMNAFSVRVHSNREVYMVDNGPNVGYGKESTSCTTNLETEPTYPDKFLHVRRGLWYGHPNRNRGLYTPGEARQCIFRPIGTTSGGKSSELTPIESSTNGLVEYASGIQGADFKGAMCLARIGFDAKGNSFAFALNARGDGITRREEIFTEIGGLDMYMDRHASLVVTEYIGGRIKVLRAAPPPWSSFGRAPVALISVLPDRGPPIGGNTVTLTVKLPLGASTLNTMVWFGRRAASDIAVFAPDRITCTVPRGVPLQLVHVTVAVNRVYTMPVGAGDYRYMERTTNRGLPAWLRAMRTAQFE